MALNILKIKRVSRPDDPQDVKMCSLCAEVLPLQYFHNSQIGKMGRKSRCKKCTKITERSRLYQISVSEYNLILSKQSGGCGICGNKEKPLKIDHNHTNGVIRGLLCDECNLGLGILGDSKESMKTVANYLSGDYIFIEHVKG